MSERPGDFDLAPFMEASASRSLDEVLEQSLLEPVRDLLKRPGKRIRGQLVELGFLLADGQLEPQNFSHCDRVAQALEILHAGSLIVDDIQDGSATRRGDAALHVRYGIPIALNAGNWLYFWPLQLIKELALAPAMEIRMYQLFHHTLLRAHLGQAVDLGSRLESLPQSEIPSLCRTTLELKTGALVSLALELGATLGNATQGRQAALNRFGHRFGTCLQMFDDLGKNRIGDLEARKPSWLWYYAAQFLDEEGYAAFVSAVKALPERAFIDQFFVETAFLESAKEEARNRLNQAIDELQAEIGILPEAVFAQLDQLRDKLENGYVQS